MAEAKPFLDEPALPFRIEREMRKHDGSAMATIVYGDPVRVRQILGNFITDAVKFTVAGSIRIGATPAGRGVRLAVTDTDCGVDADARAQCELRKAFSPSALPIIALTAAALVSERDQALAAGMNDFLTKPIDAPKLRRTLARHVRRGDAAPAAPAR